MPRFQLMRGRHHEDGVTYIANVHTKTFPVIDSYSDLTKVHGIEKFKPLGGGKPVLSTRELQLLRQRQAIERQAQLEAESREIVAGLPPLPKTAPAPGVVPDDAPGSVTEQEPSEPAPEDFDDGLEHKTVQELKELAEAEEIDLSGVHRKDDIIARIRESV
jgi:hypothetical protein